MIPRPCSLALILAAALIAAGRTPAQDALLVETNGQIFSPTNFFEANAAEIARVAPGGSNSVARSGDTMSGDLFIVNHGGLGMFALGGTNNPSQGLFFLRYNGDGLLEGGIGNAFSPEAGPTVAWFDIVDGNSTWYGTVTASSFTGAHTGDGAGITNLNATLAFGSGQVPDARIPSALTRDQELTDAVAGRVNRAGDTMSGDLFIVNHEGLGMLGLGSTNSPSQGLFFLRYNGDGLLEAGLGSAFTPEAGPTTPWFDIVDGNSTWYGTVTASSFTGAHAGDGAGITNLNASTAFATGTIPIARLATGTPNGSKFIRDDGTLATPPGGGGTGDVVGPASATDGRIALYDGTTGKLLKVGTLSESALALLNAANVFTGTNTFQSPTTFASLIITNLDLLNPIPNRGVSNATPSRFAVFGADNRLTNDIAETGTGAPVRSVSPALTGSPTVPTASIGASNTVAANTEYVDRAVAAGGGGGSGTSVTVNGATVNPAKFTNNAAATGGIILVTNANGEILMVATNFPAGGGDASVGVNNVFTGANRFTNATPQSFSRPPRVLGGRIAAWTAPQMTPGTNSSIQAQYRVLGDGVPSMEFDGTTSEEISMLGLLGQDPDTGSTVTLTFASDDTANTVCWQAQWQLLTLRGIDTNLLSTAATWTSNIPGTARVPTNITIALNPPTGVIGGTNDFSKPYMLRITRLPGSDSSLSNAYLIAVDHRYAQ